MVHYGTPGGGEQIRIIENPFQFLHDWIAY